MTAVPAHPLGSRAKVLLTSVFGPYARDDEYGSRAINPMGCNFCAPGGFRRARPMGRRVRWKP